MKKFLSTAAALGLVAGLAATASALELKVTGSYEVDGYYVDQGASFRNADGSITTGVFPFDLEGVDEDSDSWYWHEFRLNPDLIINDKVMVKGDIRLVDSNSVWGSQDDLQRFDGGGVRVDKIWLVYDSPIGKWEIGRRPAGAWLGPFVNSGTAADRIMLWAPKMDNFKAYAFLQKSVEQDAYNDVVFQEDTDEDYYEVAGGYVTEGMNLWLGAAYIDDNNTDVGPAGYDVNWYRIKGAGDFKINDTFSLAGEFDWKGGDAGRDRDREGFAWIISGMGNFGDLSASLHYAYISGQDDSEDLTAYDATHGTGDDFEPLYILTGAATNVLNGDMGAHPVGTAVRTSGAHAIVALADFKMSEDLTLHGGVGWGMADETDWIGPNIDDEYGWEFDLGLAYKLYQNLTYEVHFGWWAVGDFADLAAGPEASSEDVLLLSHHLSMKF